MDEKRQGRNETGLNRRRFIGALGAAASAAAFIRGEAAKGATTTVMYQDSFDNIVPASPDAIAAGTMPPPIYTPTADQVGTTYVQPDYTQPNILLIMVDQMRVPKWLPPGGQAAIDAICPNIANLRNTSYQFPNYFVAATACSPSRATLLTGLYAQQTYMFESLDTGTEPRLVAYNPSQNIGFPTIGNVLSGVGYNCTWIGKWHLSAFGTGSNGPSAYGFNYSNNDYDIPGVNPDGKYPLQTGATYPSPDGIANGGAMGDAIDGSAAPATSSSPYPNLPLSPPFNNLISDGAIGDAFVNYWLRSAPAQPWFCAVSFINPHDLSDFPFSYGLAGSTQYGGVFGQATNPPGNGFVPPPTGGYGPQGPNADGTTIAPLPASTPRAEHHQAAGTTTTTPPPSRIVNGAPSPGTASLRFSGTSNTRPTRPSVESGTAQFL
jgi:Sulfatase